jgi:carboxyl-terminal processing protease
VFFLPFFRRILPQVAAAFIAAALVASCETSKAGNATGGRDSADASIERVVLQAYRIIGDRYIYNPDFPRMAAQTYRGFASSDSHLVLQTSDNSFTVLSEGHQILSRPVPGDASDGRAWGSMLAELFAASIDASPVLRGTDRQVLIKQAMTATTKQLDRNSRYADPGEARDNRFQRDGGGGIGITVERTDDGKIWIRDVQDASPAAKSGLEMGDQIISIDGQVLGDRPLSDVIQRLRGAIGAPLALSVVRSAPDRQINVALKRSRIIPTTVSYERQGDIAVIKLMSFNTATTETLRKTVERARSEIGPVLAGIVLDMRGNRGGLLDQALTVSEEFIGEGMVFATQGRHPDSRRTYLSESGRKAVDVPIVVLLNGMSASAAEIVAAALQDRGRAAVVGTTSYGKGTVQTVMRLPNEGELVLTWSRLLAPSGYTWNELGILPNVCTAKVSNPQRLGPEAADANRSTLLRWHAERNPTPEEVSHLRQICPPGEGSPDRDLDIATNLLRDRTIYALAVRAGTDQASR